MRKVLIVLTALMMWGPPRLRLDPRPLGAAIEQPFDLDAAALFQVSVWVLSAVAVAVILGGRGLSGRAVLPPLLWKSSLRLYLGYGLLALVSTVYSVSPLYTAFFAGKILISILAVALLTDRAALFDTSPIVLKIYFFVSVVQCLLNVGIAAIDPTIVGMDLPNIGYRLSGGIFGDYGTAAAISGLYFLAQAVFYSRGLSRALYWALYILTWGLVILSRTRSTIIGAIVVLIVLLALLRSYRARILSGVLAALAVLVTISAGAVDAITVFGLRGQDPANLITLTGRSNAFAFLFAEWQKSPWLGFGYAAGSRALLMQFVRDSGLGIGSAHDAASRVLADLGVVGASLLVIIFLAAWVEAVKMIRNIRHDPKLEPLAIQLLVLLTFFTLTNIVAAGIAEVTFPFLIVSSGVAVVAGRHNLEIQRARRAARVSPVRMAWAHS